MQLKEALERSLPGVSIQAMHYPPSLLKQSLSSLVTVAQWAVIIAAMGGSYVSDAVTDTPFQEAVDGLQQNKLPACGMAWFLGGSLSRSMLKYGAFDVELRDDDDAVRTVWSGIERGGRPPMSQEEMMDILHAVKASGVGGNHEVY